MTSKLDPTPQIDKPVLLDFSAALLRMRTGGKLSRKGWNGANQFVYFVPAAVYDAQTEVAKLEFGEQVQYGAYLAIKTVSGIVVPWLASQTDLLIDDWYEVV